MVLALGRGGTPELRIVLLPAVELARPRAAVLSAVQGSRSRGSSEVARGTRPGLELEGGAIATPESERPGRVPSATEAANSRSYVPVGVPTCPSDECRSTVPQRRAVRDKKKQIEKKCLET
jgi:hypothetical protein